MLFEPIELKDKHPSYLTENDRAELQKVKWLGEHYKSVFIALLFLAFINNRKFYTYFEKSNCCRTTVEVNALPTDIAIELKCIAIMDEKI